MTRINRPDTLLTELRDLKRRLRLLEAGQMRPPAALIAAAREPSPSATGGGWPVPLLPARPIDWPATSSAPWERLWLTWLPSDAPAVRVALLVFSEPGTAGEVRVTVDGEPLATSVTVIGGPVRHTAHVPSDDAERELTVDARRTQGDGLVRVAAQVLR